MMQEQALRDICLETLTAFVEDKRLDTTLEGLVQRLQDYTRAAQVAILHVHGEKPAIRLHDHLSSGPYDLATVSTAVTALGLGHSDEERLTLRTIEGEHDELPEELNRVLPGEGARMLLAPIPVHPALGYALILIDRGRTVQIESDWHYVETMLRALSLAVRQRTAERQRMVQALNLREALEEAKLANEAKSRFLATMSHEIRTPMTAIVGFSKLLEKDAELPPAKKSAWARSISQNADYLLSLVNDILDLSKIEANEFELDVQPVPLRKVLRYSLELFEPRAHEKLLEFEFVQSGPLPDLLPTDALRLQQILVNLLSNAIKYTKSGSVQLIAGLEPEPETQRATRFMRFEVKDTGIGIPREIQGELFREFKQVHRDHGTSGTGLGLALVKRLVGMLGGEVGVQSEQGQGSTFAVRLPIPAGFKLTFDGSLRLSNAEVAEEQLRLLGGARALVVDDTETNRELFSYLLESAGAHVTVACDGDQGVQSVLTAREQGRPFDIILTDIQMPVADGYELTRRLVEAGIDEPIVALTAFSTASDQRRCEEAGCTGFIAKPVDPSRFALLVATHMKLERPRVAPSAGSATGFTKEQISVIETMAKRLVETFPEWMAKAAELREEESADALRVELHRLKGTGGSLGFQTLSELSARGEKLLLEDQPLQDLDGVLAEIRTEMESLMQTSGKQVSGDETVSR